MILWTLKFLLKVFSNPSLPHCSNVASIVVVAAPQHAKFNLHRGGRRVMEAFVHKFYFLFRKP
jgi:hypothetical protein